MQEFVFRQRPQPRTWISEESDQDRSRVSGVLGDGGDPFARAHCHRVLHRGALRNPRPTRSRGMLWARLVMPNIGGAGVA
jgi:hypothetical protein